MGYVSTLHYVLNFFFNKCKTVLKNKACLKKNKVALPNSGERNAFSIYGTETVGSQVRFPGKQILRCWDLGTRGEVL